MHPTADLLDCCEEAFLFDLAREDVWLYNCSRDGSNTSSRYADVTTDTSSFASYEASQHRRVAAVEWATLRLLLRHAFCCGASLPSNHAADNFVVTTLLDAKPLTASAAVAARNRLVGRRLPTRDLVRMTSRAGPLLPDGLLRLKALFSTLLTLEKALVDVVVAEGRDRHSIRESEASAHASLIAKVHRAVEESRYTRALQQQLRAQEVVVNAFGGSSSGVASMATRSSPIQTIVSDTTQHDTSSLLTSGELTYVEANVGAPLRALRAGVDLLHDALHSARASLQSDTWCREPMQTCMVQYTERVDGRVNAVAAKVAVAREAVGQLRRVRAGRRLRWWLAQQNPVTGTRDDIAESCNVVHSAGSVDRGGVCCSLFRSVASLSEGWRCAEKDGSDNANAAMWTGGTAAVDFPSFDYFAEYCDVYTSTATVDERWQIFAHYAGSVANRGSGSGDVRADRWFDTQKMSEEDFGRFVQDWTRCAEGREHMSLQVQAASSFMAEAVMPRWVTAPVLASGTSLC